MARVLVFDVNETLLDLRALREPFVQVFDDAAPLGEWFARLLHASLVATVTDAYEDFALLGRRALDAVAFRHGRELSDDDRDAILGTMSSGGVGAVTRAPYGTFRAIPAARALLEGAMHEVWALGRALGVDIPTDAVARALALVDGMEPHVTSSMQRDIIAGRPSELEEWNGAVVRLGREVGVETPVHSLIYAAFLPQELRARGSLEFPEPPPP